MLLTPQDKLAEWIKSHCWFEIERALAHALFPEVPDGPAHHEQLQAWCEHHGLGHMWTEDYRLRIFRLSRFAQSAGSGARGRQDDEVAEGGGGVQASMEGAVAGG